MSSKTEDLSLPIISLFFTILLLSQAIGFQLQPNVDPILHTFIFTVVVTTLHSLVLSSLILEEFFRDLVRVGAALLKRRRSAPIVVSALEPASAGSASRSVRLDHSGAEPPAAPPLLESESKALLDRGGSSGSRPRQARALSDLMPAFLQDAVKATVPMVPFLYNLIMSALFAAVFADNVAVAQGTLYVMPALLSLTILVLTIFGTWRAWLRQNGRLLARREVVLQALSSTLSHEEGGAGEGPSTSGGETPPPVFTRLNSRRGGVRVSQDVSETVPRALQPESEPDRESEPAALEEAMHVVTALSKSQPQRDSIL